MSQEELAFRIGRNQRYVSHLEGRNAADSLLPDAQTTRLLVDALGVTLTDLLIAAGYLDAPEQGAREETDDERLARMRREVDQYADPLVRRVLGDTFRLAASIEEARRSTGDDAGVRGVSGQ